MGVDGVFFGDEAGESVGVAGLVEVGGGHQLAVEGGEDGGVAPGMVEHVVGELFGGGKGRGRAGGRREGAQGFEAGEDGFGHAVVAFEGHVDGVEEEFVPGRTAGGDGGEEFRGVEDVDAGAVGGIVEDAVEGGIAAEAEGVVVARGGEEAGGFVVAAETEGEEAVEVEGFGVEGVAEEDGFVEAPGFVGHRPFVGDGPEEGFAVELGGFAVGGVVDGQGAAVAEVDGRGAGDDDGGSVAGEVEDGVEVVTVGFAGGVEGGGAGLEAAEHQLRFAGGPDGAVGAVGEDASGKDGGGLDEAEAGEEHQRAGEAGGEPAGEG